MQSSRRDFLKLAGAALAGSALMTHWAQAVAAAQGSSVYEGVPDPALHLLNRVTYAPRPEDVARIRQIGADAWLEAQLAPETIDDLAGDEVMRHLPILSMDRRTVHRLGFDGRVHNALTQGMILRAVHSERQLYERMVEFWTDHFNVPADELAHDLVIMHREVIRRHALGNFRDLVLGTAQSPAMLTYLDQAYSSKEHPNENYARELMELHTLGVAGGYTEADVQAAARALTGWTIHNGTASGFYFDPEMHDTDPKTLLGHQMPADRGIEDGLHLISLLVNHPSTARFICRKLCVRFVSDTPPDSLIESSARIWRETRGAIVPVLRHILTSPEFYASAGQKLRRPLDFFIGVLRITGTRYLNEWLMQEHLADLAQPPYGWNPPNGYPDAAGAWLSSNGLLARWNVAMSLTHAAWSEPDSGMATRLDRLIDSPETVGELVAQAAQRVFGAAAAPSALTPYIDFVSDGGGEQQSVTPALLSNKLGMLFGMLFASPQYQWR
ncbi:DUF1800 domain-containing protein [Anaerolineae bacterium CFX9]|nr:DUF1800 domain-containing protein [Anaerolineae bacterium CFX9]